MEALARFNKWAKNPAAVYKWYLISVCITEMTRPLVFSVYPVIMFYGQPEVYACQPLAQQSSPISSALASPLHLSQSIWLADSVTDAGLHLLPHCPTTGESRNALSAFIITLMELEKGECQ